MPEPEKLKLTAEELDCWTRFVRENWNKAIEADVFDAADRMILARRERVGPGAVGRGSLKGWAWKDKNGLTFDEEICDREPASALLYSRNSDGTTDGYVPVEIREIEVQP